MWMNIFEICISLFDFTVFMWFFQSVSEGYQCRYPKAKMAILGALFVVIIYIFDMHGILPSIKLLVLMVLMMPGVYHIFRLSIIKNVTVIIYFVCATVISEASVMGILMSIQHEKSPGLFFDGGPGRIQCVFISKIVFIALLFVLKSIMNRRTGGYTRKELLILVVQTVSSLLVLVMSVEMTMSFQVVNLVPPLVLTAVAAGAFFAYCVSVWITDHYFKSQRIIQENIRLEEFRKYQERYSTMRSEAEQGVRQIYHDLKRHMKAIDKMQHGNTGELSEYVEDLNEILKSYENIYNTGCEVLDMVLEEKRTEAERAGIRFDVKVEEKSLAGFRTMNLNVIFTNALDNAIEANVIPEMKEGEKTDRFIGVRVRKEREGVSILIRNTYFLEPVSGGAGIFQTIKADKEQHGIGVGSIRSAVRALAGRMSVESSDGIFVLYILLPLPEHPGDL